MEKARKPDNKSARAARQANGTKSENAWKNIGKMAGIEGLSEIGIIGNGLDAMMKG